VNNVDTFYETIKARSARERLVEDPDQHKIRFVHWVHMFDKDKALSTMPIQ
jgi:hypothetical protein